MNMRKVTIGLLATEMITRVDQLVIEVPEDATTEDIESIDGEDVLVHYAWEPRTIWHSEEMGGDTPLYGIEVLKDDLEGDPKVTFVPGKDDRLIPACDAEKERAVSAIGC